MCLSYFITYPMCIHRKFLDIYSCSGPPCSVHHVFDIQDAGYECPTCVHGAKKILDPDIVPVTFYPPAVIFDVVEVTVNRMGRVFKVRDEEEVEVKVSEEMPGAAVEERAEDDKYDPTTASMPSGLRYIPSPPPQLPRKAITPPTTASQPEQQDSEPAKKKSPLEAATRSTASSQSLQHTSSHERLPSPPPSLPISTVNPVPASSLSPKTSAHRSLVETQLAELPLHMANAQSLPGQFTYAARVDRSLQEDSYWDGAFRDYCGGYHGRDVFDAHEADVGMVWAYGGAYRRYE